MDTEVTALVTAFPLDSGRAEEWFTTMRAVWQVEQTDLDAFVSRLRDETGHLVDPHDLDLFRRALDDLGGDPMDHLRRLIEHEPYELADHLRAEPSGDRFDWVQPDQSDRMTAAWGQDWPDVLAEQLDYRWGAGWEVHPPEDKVEWLNDVLGELLAEPPSEEAGRFDWVPVEQADRLTSAWGADWRQYLGEQLDHRWGEGWEANPDDHKAAWLPELVDVLLAPAEDIPAQADAPDHATDATPEEYTADEIKAVVDEVVAEMPGVENLSEEELAAIRAEVAEELAKEAATQ